MNPMRMFWGFILAGLGLLILGAELGWWNSSFWVNIFYLWPLILVVIGLRLIVRDDVIFSILMLAVLAIGGYLAVTGTNPFTNGRFRNGSETFSESISQNLDSNAKSGSITLNLGASNVKISNLEEADSKSYLAKLETKDYGKLKTEQRINNGELEYEISEDLERGFFFGPSRKREFDGKFTTILPVKLEINSGATNFDLDLSKLKVESLNLNTGASNGQIVFGKNVALVKASVKTGASKIEIKVPKGTGVKLRYNVNGLNNRDFAPGLNLNRESDDRYVSKDYETAANKIELDIDAGVSNIQIVEY